MHSLNGLHSISVFSLRTQVVMTEGLSTMSTLGMPDTYKMQWLFLEGRIEKQLFLMFLYVYTNHYFPCTKNSNWHIIGDL